MVGRLICEQSSSREGFLGRNRVAGNVVRVITVSLRMALNARLITYCVSVQRVCRTVRAGLWRFSLVCDAQPLKNRSVAYTRRGHGFKSPSQALWSGLLLMFLGELNPSSAPIRTGSTVH